MKQIICFNLLVRATFLTAIIVFVAGSAVAQYGAWVPHAVPSGPYPQSPVEACGSGCLGYARNGSSLVLFYDINQSQWIEANLGTPQQYHSMFAIGDVVCAYSDTFLIAYSAITATWDTMRIVGTPLSYTAPPYNSPLGCEQRLAVFATNMMFYVFDAEQGIWKKYAYGYPSDFAAVAALDARDDYAEMVLSRSLGNPYQHTVYSRITKTFNQINSYASISKYAHGYIGMGAVSGNQGEYLGYCAATNNFSVLTLSDGVDVTYGTERATSWGVHRDRSVDDGTHSFELYCYDTRLGNWSLDSATYHYDANSGTEIGAPRGGDHFIRFGSYNFPPAYTEGITTYSGQTGQFTTINPTIFINQGPSVSFDGSTIFMEGGNSNVLAWDVLNGRGCSTSLSHDIASNCYIGEDYCAFSEWNNGSDSMVTQFYNRSTNAWISVHVPQYYASSGVNASDAAYVMPFPVATPLALFYSSITNTYTTAAFASSDLVSVDVKGIFARAFSLDKTCLFDAQSGIIHNISTYYGHASIGDTVAVYYEDDNTIHGYSGLSKNWTSVTMDEPAYWLGAKGYIGLIATLKYLGYHKFYAFNGLHDKWVELPYSGTYVTLGVGERTALVVRSDTMYAFDPQAAITSVQNITHASPTTFNLEQNYPNPFNPFTNISFSLPSKSLVSLKVFDLLGREVTTIISEILPAGNYTRQWNAINMSSGVYFYRLHAGSFSETRKLVLLR